MKIVPLLEELVQTKTTRKNYRGEFKGHPDDVHDKPNVLGQGAFSVVRQDKNDPHMVKKSHFHPMNPIKRQTEDDYTLDGFDIYADYITQNKLGDNIHFPKIYKNARFQDKNDQHVSKYTMEKLVPWSELDIDELNSIAERYFRIDPNSESFSLSKRHKADTIAFYLDEAVRSNNYDAIRTTGLKEALKVIRMIYREKNIIMDIHKNNVMFRRTPYGLQLVITDPLSFKH